MVLGIVDKVLNICCPRCGQVFGDFDNCFALTVLGVHVAFVLGAWLIVEVMHINMLPFVLRTWLLTRMYLEIWQFGEIPTKSKPREMWRRRSG
jgi:hypothetical protein